MTNDDAARFAKVMAALAEVYQVEPTKARTDLYFDALADLSIDLIEQAAHKALRTLKWFPQISELRDYAKIISHDEFVERQTRERLALPAPAETEEQKEQRKKLLADLWVKLDKAPATKLVPAVTGGDIEREERGQGKAEPAPNTPFSDKEQAIASRIYSLMIGAGYAEEEAENVCVITDPTALEPHVIKLCRLRQMAKDPFGWLREELWPKPKRIKRS